jgi:glycosyltransferase involved in cell wall biosynthesis
MNIAWQRARLPLPVQIFTGAIDLYHSPDFTLPPSIGAPRVLTIHDLAFLRVPDCAFPTLRRYLERAVPHSIRGATRLIAVSENTKHDLVDLLDVDPAKVTTIHEGVGSDFRPAVDLSVVWSRLHQHGIHDSYILAVGTLEPRKNYSRLLDAYAMLRGRGVRQRLVIAGAPGWLYEPIYWQVRDSRLEQSVTVLRPDDAMLISLYQAADAFVYPSLYEGFGIPPIEALACGTPVACSNTSSLPELVGDAAVTFDPLEVGEIAEAVAKCLSDDGLRADLRARGPERAASFSWGKAAAETFALYKTVADSA